MDHTDERSGNPVPGVVVDRHITGYGERIWDFYLQPHKVLQGTAKPAHYVVLKNEIGFDHEQFEKLVRIFTIYTIVICSLTDIPDTYVKLRLPSSHQSCVTLRTGLLCRPTCRACSVLPLQRIQ